MTAEAPVKQHSRVINSPDCFIVMNVSYFARNGNGTFFPCVLADMKLIIIMMFQSMVNLTLCHGKMEKMTLLRCDYWLLLKPRNPAAFITACVPSKGENAANKF